MNKNLVAIHEKSKSYDWEHTFAEYKPRWDTKYKIPRKGRDPFRVLVRDYMRMEAEKDERTYGCLDGLLRMRQPAHTDQRFLESMKLMVPNTTNAEFQAVAGCGMMIQTFQNQELRQGYAAQMLDEQRHVGLQMALRNYYVKNSPDPAGWDVSQRGLYQHPAGHVSLAQFQGFNTGDPGDVILGLNVVTETGFSNMLLVALPQVAVRNGDDALATAFLSVQSDESRHMANGYGALMMMLQEEENVPLLNQGIERFFWMCHKTIDSLVGWGCEYGATERPQVFKDLFQEWVVDNWVGDYIDRLSEFGITHPTRLAEAAVEVEWSHHSVAMVLAAAWPLNFWRSDPMGHADFEWFEHHYPGWSEVYLPFWQGYSQMLDPSCAHLMLQEFPSLPPFCQVCQLPCVLPHPGASTFRLVDIEGRQLPACSAGCEWMLRTWPKAYGGTRQFWEKYHEWDLADVILDLGYIRPDGRTLMGQPSTNLTRLWTIDDIRRIGYEVKNPLHGLN